MKNATDPEVTGMNTEAAANDLTQLSSREQLSALMDGALPEDQTRFLLRRLRHDATLAESWERWRIAGEVMRGLAPARRMPADFAGRVSAALHGDAVAAPRAAVARRPAWLRWGGGLGAAAALGMVALFTHQPAPVATDAALPTVVAASTDASPGPAAPLPAAATQAPSMPAQAEQALTAATAVAVASRPARRRAAPARAAVPMPAVADADAAPVRTVLAAADAPAAGKPARALPLPAQSEIITRPWPRSVLPHYGADAGLTVGFGQQHGGGMAAYNPFPASSLGRLAPSLEALIAEREAARAAAGEGANAADAGEADAAPAPAQP